MCTYLATRQSTYYFRRVVPAELRPFLGNRREWMISLGTKDRETAKRMIPAHTIATNAEIDRATSAMNGAEKPPASPAPPRSKRAEAMEAAMLESSLEAAEIGYQEMNAREERYAEREPLRLRWRRLVRKSTAELTDSEAAARDIIRDLEAELSEAQLRRLEAQTAAAEKRRGLAPPEQRRAPQAETVEGVMLDSTIVCRWAAERKVTEKTRDAHAAVARWFYERAGRLPVNAITRKDVLTFKNKLIAEGQSAANVNTKIARLATLIQWAVDNEYASENSAKGVSVKDIDKARNKRREFDLASLNAIFASPVYAEGARPTQGRGEAAYWLPLLALFTGARLEELGQLRPSDILEIAYPDPEGAQRKAWFIRIKEDHDEGLRLKNAASERDVPVHPELERLGFIKFVEKAKEAKQERLFPLLRANKYGTLTAKWGEWWSGYRRTVCGITDHRLTFHSFRHTYKQYARHSDIPEGVQRQIMGHSAGDVADEYGSGYPLHQVVEGMRRFRVPGLALPV
ncbi:DUF6538 domain-containing protein [uncultured Sphingomonas sp.]|uniref:DUF6538 domain-containing protein n=1 Tax=uncultured Sphingomonas sp. TaxID=158754 RepID=UPI0025CBF3FC|nr:DUF6538 domain-containing protein [uncultured Sphingomonas sp.]